MAEPSLTPFKLNGITFSSCSLVQSKRVEAGSCAIDFQTESVLSTKTKNECELELSVFYLIKHFPSENQLHLTGPKS